MEIVDLNKALATKFAKSDATFASTEINPVQSIQPGFSDKVTALGYVAISGPRVSVRSVQQGDQKIMIGNEEVIIAKEGELSKTFALSFEGGRTISLATLMQSPKTVVNGKAANKTPMKDFYALIGKTLTLDSAAIDTDNDVVIANQPASADGKLATRNPRAYNFGVK